MPRKTLTFLCVLISITLYNCEKGVLSPQKEDEIDIIPPTISDISPSSYEENSPYILFTTVGVTVTDNNKVAWVEGWVGGDTLYFYEGEQKKTRRTEPIGTSGYLFVWSPSDFERETCDQTIGCYKTIKITASDVSGNTSTGTKSMHYLPLDMTPPDISSIQTYQWSWGTVDITANITDNREIDFVSCYVDGLIIGTDVFLPYEFTWSPWPYETSGYKNIMITAYDKTGNISEKTFQYYWVPPEQTNTSK